MKRITAILALAVCFALPGLAGAAGTCTTVNVGNSASTQVLAANDQGSNGRRWLYMVDSSAAAATPNIAYCNIGGAAAANQGIVLTGAASITTSGTPNPAVPVVITGIQVPAKTFPIVPNGAVNCFGSASTSNVTVCDY